MNADGTPVVQSIVEQSYIVEILDSTSIDCIPGDLLSQIETFVFIRFGCHITETTSLINAPALRTLILLSTTADKVNYNTGKLVNFLFKDNDHGLRVPINFSDLAKNENLRRAIIHGWNAVSSLAPLTAAHFANTGADFAIFHTPDKRVEIIHNGEICSITLVGNFYTESSQIIDSVLMGVEVYIDLSLHIFKYEMERMEKLWVTIIKYGSKFRKLTLFKTDIDFFDLVIKKIVDVRTLLPELKELCCSNNLSSFSPKIIDSELKTLKHKLQRQCWPAKLTRISVIFDPCPRDERYRKVNEKYRNVLIGGYGRLVYDIGIRKNWMQKIMANYRCAKLKRTEKNASKQISS